MAKIIYNTNGEFSHYHPGVIYDIGYIDQTTNTRIPFYVGETSNFEQRLKDHQRAGKNADATSTLVYQTIKEFNEADITWTMEPIVEFGQEGPTDLEDEWIMRYLYDGHKLTNMKKGNANWMVEREVAAKDMRKRGISSYRKYRQIITQEDADRKHAEWQRKELEKKRLQEEAEMLVRSKERNNQLIFERQQKERREILEATQRKQEEKIRQQKLLEEKKQKAIAEAAAKWEADRPAREARIKADTERLQDEELRRREEIQRYQEQQRLKEQQANQAFIDRYNKNYSQWPNPIDRAYHQRMEDAQVRLRRASLWTEEEIIQELEIDRRMSWPPSRTQ